MKNPVSVLCTAAVCIASCMTAGCADGLEERIAEIAGSADAQVGVAVIPDSGCPIVVNDGKYPLMSVVKFPLALAVADWMHETGLDMDTVIHVKADEMKSGTYSPLKKLYPEGDVRISLRELLRYSLQLSDNNACDILFRLIGGPEVADRYMRSIGLDGFGISRTEDDMHKDLSACYDNWATPFAAAEMMDIFWRSLEKDGGKPFWKEIYSIITECETGTDRLPAPLAGTGAVIGHKTGTGDVMPDGRLMALNDAGFVLLPDGRCYSIAVLIRDCKANPEDAAAIIAAVSEAVFEEFR